MFSASCEQSTGTPAYCQASQKSAFLAVAEPPLAALRASNFAVASSAVVKWSSPKNTRAATKTTTKTPPPLGSTIRKEPIARSKWAKKAGKWSDDRLRSAAAEVRRSKNFAEFRAPFFSYTPVRNVQFFEHKTSARNFLGWFISCFGDRLWLFAIVFILERLGGMRLVCISQFVESISAMCFGSFVGNWLDRHDR